MLARVRYGAGRGGAGLVLSSEAPLLQGPGGCILSVVTVPTPCRATPLIPCTGPVSCPPRIDGALAGDGVGKGKNWAGNLGGVHVFPGPGGPVTNPNGS